MWSQNMLRLEIIDLSWNNHPQIIVIEELELKLLRPMIEKEHDHNVLFFGGAGRRGSQHNPMQSKTVMH